MSRMTDTQVDAVASAATSLVAALRAVVDTEAHGEPSCSPRPGTSSAGGSGQRPPAAPSNPIREVSIQPTPQVGDKWRYIGPDKRFGTSVLARVTNVDSRPRTVCAQLLPLEKGHGIGGWTVASWARNWRLIERGGRPWPPAQEPERPRKGEVWAKGGMRVRLHRKAGSPTNTRGDWLWVATIVELMPELDGPWAVGETITVELDRCGWFCASPAQEQEPVAGVERCRCPYPSSGHSTRHADDCPRRRDLSLPEWPSGPPPAQEPEPVAGVEPATDAQIAEWERHPNYRSPKESLALIACVRQEQLFSSRMEYERDVAVHRRERAEAGRDEAVARAEAAEATLARVELQEDQA